MDVEIWKDIHIPNYEYQVSNLGRVRSKNRKVSNHTGIVEKKSQIMKPHINYKGYAICCISYKNKKKHIPIHRMVALAFIPNPNNYPQINHIDGNKKNNCVNNLEWCNNSLNQLHAYKMGLNKRVENAGRKRIQICKIDMKTKEIIEIYNSINDASKENKLNAANINSVRKGKRNHCGGFIWKEIKEGVVLWNN